MIKHRNSNDVLYIHSESATRAYVNFAEPYVCLDDYEIMSCVGCMM